MARRGFARADRTRARSPGKPEKVSTTTKAASILASDRTERPQIIERLRDKQ